MNGNQRPLVALVVLGLLSGTAAGVSEPPTQKEKHEHKQKEQKETGQGKEKKPKKEHHNNGKSLLGDKIKKNGRHQLDKKGDYTASVDVKDGKVAGVDVKHATKGAVPVTKYKSKQKMALGPAAPVLYASLQTEYVDTVWIGYAYVNEWGEEEIYWFPYDMIYDGDTGAIWYEPAY